MNIAAPPADASTARSPQAKPLPPSLRARGVTAVLGPTNTGKTSLAIDRMLGHSSGLIGLPLRLLAREVYGKLVARAGIDHVALITGEERIKPKNPRYWVATVEAMPRDLDVAFVALDEIQIAADLDRGHVFTDRMLNRRGREETLLLGAATMRPLVERLIPGASVLVRPRLSNLLFAGEKKITRLPRRSAIVAFSADEVYAIAELIRRQRGGAAVVLGALSPRTRNAQVELYQSGDVDYLIATDAIGMGLNLDVDHVAFAGDVKFDGWQFRKLNAGEFAQIAGRAGRAQRDGTFGTTGRCRPFDAELVERLESHSFDAHRVLQWRNTALDFRSIETLLRTLSEPAREEGLTRAPTADDVRVLEAAARDPEVKSVATGTAGIERLWEACQLPDYRKVSPASHSDLVVAVYGFLMRQGRIPDDWFAKQVALADRTEGDIDTLSGRIAQIRTWTFAANRPDWLGDPEHWQAVTRRVEDKLSDALHERLTHRFVDRRTSVLMRRLRENKMLDTEITKTGDVVVEGHVIGHLLGFQFAADPSAGGPEAKALRATAQKALTGEIEARATRLAEAPDDSCVLSADGTLRWIGEPVAKLLPGEEVLEPKLRLIADEYLTGPARDAAQARIDLWMKAHVEKLLGPLLALGRATDLTGIARGIAFQIVEALGVLERQKVAEEMKTLPQEARALLRGYGVRFGAHTLYLPALLKPAPRTLAAQLWALKHGGLQQKGLDELPHLAASGRTSIPVDHEIQKGLYRAVGFRVAGERAVRVDILERLADLIRPALAWRPHMPGEKPAGAYDGTGFVATVAMTSLAGCAGEDFATILRALGYRMEKRPPLAEPAPVAAAAPTEAVAADSTAGTAEAGTAETDAAGDTAAAVAEGGESSAPVSGAPETPAAGLPDHVAAEAAILVAALGHAAPEESAAPTDAGIAASADATGAQSAEAAPAATEAADVPPPAGADAASADGWTDRTDNPSDRTDQAAAEAPEAAHQDTVEVAPAAAAAPAEPVLVEVWRPGRPPGQQRHQHHGRGKPQGGRAAPADAAGAPAERPNRERNQEVGGNDRPREGRGRDDRNADRRDRFRGPRQDAPAARGRDERQGPREDRPRNERPRPERSRDERPAQAPRPDARRDKPVDPDSPFAALMALKARMEAEKNGN